MSSNIIIVVIRNLVLSLYFLCLLLIYIFEIKSMGFIDLRLYSSLSLTYNCYIVFIQYVFLLL